MKPQVTVRVGMTRNGRSRTHNPSVAGSSPARPTDLPAVSLADSESWNPLSDSCRHRAATSRPFAPDRATERGLDDRSRTCAKRRNDVRSSAPRFPTGISLWPLHSPWCQTVGSLSDGTVCQRWVAGDSYSPAFPTRSTRRGAPPVGGDRDTHRYRGATVSASLPSDRQLAALGL